MNIRNKALLCGGVVLAVAWLFEGPVAAAATSEEIPVGSVLREATLNGLNGTSRKLSSYLGKPLIINVWASWCGPCRAEMASLERLAWLDLAAHFSIIGISTDDYADQARALLQNNHATISHFIDTQLQIEHMLGATRLPLTLLVDAHGRVLEKVYGAREWDSAEMLAQIEKLFRIKPKLGVVNAPISSSLYCQRRSSPRWRCAPVERRYAYHRVCTAQGIWGSRQPMVA